MTKIMFLIPPSEGKNSDNTFEKEELSFEFEKPCDIATSVTEKDLKCTGKRFEEGVELNKNICREGKISFPTDIAINRYSGVMFSAIDYENMNNIGKKYFEEKFLILSGLYGIVKVKDKIGNYKLPIESKGLLDFWGDKIIEEINIINPDFVVNLLPISYSKVIFGKNKSIEKVFSKKRNFKIINVNFIKPDGKKISHGVKKIKGEWIKNICEKNISDYKDFGGEIIENGNIIDVNIRLFLKSIR
ncbi:MAG: peroxide stress protein YaaA [Candidatus Gracilibacteria bacterium]|nr:peroxide stress protein YaaA [Candidatus Gracilibacteria bacterium]MDQ7023216.1 peroxide stress protein YaaA [Candidatus Gracilibacteria bacterium]